MEIRIIINNFKLANAWEDCSSAHGFDYLEVWTANILPDTPSLPDAALRSSAFQVAKKLTAF